MVELRVSLESPADTEALGAAFARCAERGDVIFLRGELGAGKTSLSRGFLRSFFRNRQLDVPSPTYLLQFTYADDPSKVAETSASGAEGGAPAQFTATATSRVPGCVVHHVDAYRLQVGKIAALVDFKPIFENEISLIEWPEQLGQELVTETTPSRLEVSIEGMGPQAVGRTAIIRLVGDKWRSRVEGWQAAGADWWKAVEEEEDVEVAPSTSAPQPVRDVPADRPAWKVLGIESSCDDTGAAVVSGDGRILSEALASQSIVHEKFGGVKPDAAQAAHREAIDATVESALKKAEIEPKDLTAVAVTVGPGLSLCLEVGVKKAMQIAAEHRLPLIRIHHMEAHAMMTRMPLANPCPEPTFKFPFVTLLVSGGHSMVVLTRGLGSHQILGRSLDDSVGEAFDKTARLLGINKVPGGPHLEKMASEGDAGSYPLPRPFMKSKDPQLRNGSDYSFAGLKTAVRQLISDYLTEADEEDKESLKADIAASFQRACVQHLTDRTRRAIARAKELCPEIETVVVAGGVAANKLVRKELTSLAAEFGLEMQCPPIRLCVDNGVMVAWTGVERLALGLWDEPPAAGRAEMHVEVRPRWPLGEMDPTLTMPEKAPKKPKGEKRPRDPEAREQAKKAQTAVSANQNDVAEPNKAA